MFITNLRTASARKNALPQTPRWTTALAGWLRPRSICGRLELIRNYGHCNSLHTRTRTQSIIMSRFFRSCRGHLSLQLGFLTRALFFSPHQPSGARSGSGDFARADSAGHGLIFPSRFERARGHLGRHLWPWTLFTTFA